MNSRWRQRATPIRFNTGQIGQQTNERTNNLLNLQTHSQIS